MRSRARVVRRRWILEVAWYFWRIMRAHRNQRRSMGSVVSLDCAAMVVVVVRVADYSATRGRFGAANRAHEPLGRRLVL